MFKYSVTAALDNISDRAPVILRGSMESCAEKAVRTGYDAIELHLKNPAELDGRRMKAVADGYGIGFSGIATGMEYTINGLSLIAEDGNIRRNAIQRLREHIDLAQILDCIVIIGIMRANIPDFRDYAIYERRLFDGLRELADYAEKKKVVLVFESITRYINNYLNTVCETTDFVRKINSPNLLVHIDTHSMNIEDVNMVESIEYSADLLGYVHFSDSNRMYPGAGHVDFRKVQKALEKVNYQGYVSLECLPLPDSDTCSERGLKFVKSLERLS
jgi:sugar phosphate isomerase/epimerase